MNTNRVRRAHNQWREQPSEQCALHGLDDLVPSGEKCITMVFGSVVFRWIQRSHLGMIVLIGVMAPHLQRSTPEL